MSHDITIIITKVQCLIDLATGQLADTLTELRDLCTDLNTFILESSSEQEDAHTLLETIQTWATDRCAAQNVGGNCNGEAQGFINDIHQFI